MIRVIRRYWSVIGPARGPISGYLINGISVSLGPLAMVFLLREAGRAYDLIGLVLAAGVAGAAAGMLLQGRLIDRHGPPRVLLPLIVVHGIGLVAFVVAVREDWSLGAIIGITLAAGVTQPVLLPTLRALWGTLFTAEQRDTAYAAQAILTELVFVVGPLVASGVAVAASPTAAMAVAGTLSTVGVTIFALTVTRRPVVADATRAPIAARRGLAALRSGQLRALVGVALLSGITGGAIEILLPVFAETSGETERAGIGFAVMAAGSIVGGLIYGSRRWGGTVTRRFALFTGAMGVAMSPLVATPQFVVVCGILLLAGVMIAPAEACFYALIDDAADDESIVEANSWVTAMYTIGLGAGAAAGGYLADGHSLAGAAVIPGGAALLATAVILTVVRDAGGSGTGRAPSGPPSPLVTT